VYWPPTDDEATLPVIVFLHGGGWSVGDLDTYDGEARNHAVGAGALVVSVDYRLAPEHPYPAAVEDAWAATQWVAAHARELGADPDRLAVAGDSAGGNLAAVVAQLARDAGKPVVIHCREAVNDTLAILANADGPAFLVLQAPRRLLRGRQQEGVRPRGGRLEHAELPGFHAGVPGDLGEVATHQREMVVAVGVANPPDTVERVLVADVTTERVAGVGRVDDEPAATDDFSGAPDEAQLRIFWM